MSSFTTPSGERFAIFGEGGGKELADELDVPLLGKVPLTMPLREQADSGVPLVIEDPDDPASQAIRQVARGLIAMAPPHGAAGAAARRGRRQWRRHAARPLPPRAQNPWACRCRWPESQAAATRATCPLPRPRAVSPGHGASVRAGPSTARLTSACHLRGSSFQCPYRIRGASRTTAAALADGDGVVEFDERRAKMERLRARRDRPLPAGQPVGHAHAHRRRARRARRRRRSSTASTPSCATRSPAG